MGTWASQADAPEGPIGHRGRRWIRRLLPIVAASALVSYVLLGIPATGFPGRAGAGELRRVEDRINRAYVECGLDGRATIDWLSGRVDVPSTNGLVGDLPSNVDLSLEELALGTGTTNYFWVVCP